MTFRASDLRTADRGFAADALPFAASAIGGLAMALAFPKTNATFLDPVGTFALFWAWFEISEKRAFWAGWLAGTIYFSISFAWFAETVGAYIAPFGFLVVLVPALVAGLVQFGLGGALVAFEARALRARHRLARSLVPLGGAAIFAALEWFRSEALGTLSVPFASLGYSQVGTAFAPLAAFAGTYGVTFVLSLVGAYAAYALRARADDAARRDALAALVAVVLLTGIAWLAWPARTLARPTVRVAAIQGNISQAAKWTPASLGIAVATYESLSAEAAAGRPALVLWPETVVATALDEDPTLEARISRIAERLGTTLAVGTLEATPQGYYNALQVFSPSGATEVVYRKRKLVPFAERLPLRSLLGRLAWAKEISNFSPGAEAAPFAVAGLRVDPLICWESDFGGLVGDDARAGASVLAIATDDAWFGTTAGPYMHAQIAQMRALETGRWVVRAAATGISGIIAPNGRFTVRVGLQTAGIAAGAVGAPAGAPYVRVGSDTIALLLIAIYAACLIVGRRIYR